MNEATRNRASPRGVGGADHPTRTRSILTCIFF